MPATASPRLSTIVECSPVARRCEAGTLALFLGSCFADEIGHRWRSHGLHAEVNPVGVLYNPEALARVIERGREPDCVAQAELIEANGRHFHPAFGSALAFADRPSALAACHTALEGLRSGLEHARRLIITWGTSLAYVDRARGYAVGNCQQRARSEFGRVALGVDEIVQRWRPLCASWLAADPQRRIILTVSPVRHWSDGAVTNTRSKARLSLAAEALCSDQAQIDYFPAYEIVNDELRDYRFYARDMLHPSELAVDMIWQRFIATHCDEQLQQQIRAVHALTKRLSHKFRVTAHPDALAQVERMRTEVANFVDKFPLADHSVVQSALQDFARRATG